jgi:hypothetical protein
VVLATLAFFPLYRRYQSGRATLKQYYVASALVLWVVNAILFPIGFALMLYPSRSYWQLTLLFELCWPLGVAGAGWGGYQRHKALLLRDGLPGIDTPPVKDAPVTWRQGATVVAMCVVSFALVIALHNYLVR